MKLKIAFFIFIEASLIFAQLPHQIEKEAANMLLAFSVQDTIIQKDFDNLNALIDSKISNNELENNYSVSPKNYDSLKNQLSKIEFAIKTVPSDSGLVLFNSWYLQFCNTFYKNLERQFFSSKKIKILFFSASVSCYCTLEMCKNQLIDILKFVKENKEKYDYWVVDSYENGDLQIKYETYFSPSVIVFDSNNKLLQKIEYDEKMISKLKNYFTANSN